MLFETFFSKNTFQKLNELLRQCIKLTYDTTHGRYIQSRGGFTVILCAYSHRTKCFPSFLSFSMSAFYLGDIGSDSEVD